MTLSLLGATFAGVCGIAVSYGPRAPGDEFQASPRLRRCGNVLAVLGGLVLLWRFGMHPHLAVASVALLWSLALSGPLLGYLRNLGARWVLGLGTLALLGALIGALGR